MSAARLPVLATLAGALAAPFRAGSAFWKAAALPWLLALALGIVTDFAAAGDWPDGALLAARLLVLLPLVRVLVLFHRALLLSPDEVATGPVFGRREGVYFLTAVALVLLVAGLTWVLVLMLGPLVALALAALTSPSPQAALLAPLSVLLGLAVLLYLLGPLLLLLPATAADRRPSPGDALVCSRGQRVRLAAVTGALPLALAWLPGQPPTGPWALPLALALAVFGVYAALAAVAAITLAWRALAADTTADSAPDGAPAGTARAVAVLSLFLLAIAALRIADSRLPPPEVRTQLVTPPATATQDGRLVEGETTLLTIDKRSVRVRHALQWDVADPDRFEIALGGQDARVTMMLGDSARAALRELAATLDADDLATLAGAAVPDTARDRVRPHAAGLGVRVVDWRIVSATPRP